MSAPRPLDQPSGVLRAALAPRGWTADGDAWRRDDAVDPDLVAPDDVLDGWARRGEPLAVALSVRLRRGRAAFASALAGRVPVPHLGRAQGLVELFVWPRTAGPAGRVEVVDGRVVYETDLGPVGDPVAVAAAVGAATAAAAPALVRAARTLDFFGIYLRP